MTGAAYDLYSLKRSPFHERIAPLCLPQNWRRWAGYVTVGSYDLGLDREYWAIRDAAALIDVSPLMKYLIEGPDAARLLDRIIPRNIAKLAIGQVFYTGWCDDEGKLLDDGTVTRLGEQSFRLTSAEPSLRWLAMNAVGMQVAVTEVTDRMGALSLQGPKSRAILNRCCEQSLDSLKFFRMAANKLQGRSVSISRTGYTGDLGYEIWMDGADALAVWDALMAAGADYGIAPCGILAMDMARVEAGLFMIDVDYTAANHAWIAAQKSSPYEMGLGWTVNLDKPGYFVGRRALEREHREGSAWKLAGMEIAWEGLERLYAAVGLPPQIPGMAVRGSLPILRNGRQVGYASTSTWSPVLKKYIALVHLERPHYEPGTRLDIEITVQHQRRHTPGTVVALPFYEPDWEKEVTTASYDAIVIGAGHNGLIAAAYLARAGKKVVVLERRDVVGGASVTEEIFPGYRFTEFSYVVSLLRPEIIRDLELPRHGLKILPLPSTVTPFDNGDYLAAWDDHDLTRRELYRHSPKDAEAADEYARVMARAAKAIKPIISLVPPDPTSLGWRDLAGLLKLGRYGASLSERERYRIAKLTTQSAGDLLDEWFELDPLKGTKSASGIIGTFLGPRSPGTAYVLLHHYMGEIDGAFRAWGFAKNGTGGVSAAIARSAAALGVEIRTGAPVAKVLVNAGRAAGVALENGDELRSRVVLSAADPKRTFLQFVDAKHFPDEFTSAIKSFRVRGSSGKVNIALSELPQFTCLPGEGPLHRGAISISPSVDYIERAYDEAKYGQFSSRPYIDAIIPSMIDRDMAPPGHHVMSCFVQYAPYDIEGGWDDAKRDAFGETVISTLERYAPNIRRAIVGMQVITPKDIERIAGITGGNIFHGELLLHQLFFLRPSPQWADFRTPLPGYYFGAAGAHPGGGVMGAAGKLAATEVLKDWR